MKPIKRLLCAATILYAFHAGTSLHAEPDRSVEAKMEGKRQPQMMMQNKLRHINELFGALITGDLDQARKSTELLSAISRATEWQNSKSKDFVYHAQTFQRSADNVLEQIAEKNKDSIMLGYLRLALACSYCHTEIRDKVHPSPSPK
jgi:hypothetical protein